MIVVYVIRGSWFDIYVLSLVVNSEVAIRTVPSTSIVETIF